MWAVTAIAFTVTLVALVILGLENQDLRRRNAQVTEYVLALKLAEVDPVAARLAVAQRRIDSDKASMMRRIGEKQRQEINARRQPSPRVGPTTHRIAPIHSILQGQRRKVNERVAEVSGVRPESPTMEGGRGPVDRVVSPGGNGVHESGEPGENREDSRSDSGPA